MKEEIIITVLLLLSMFFICLFAYENNNKQKQIIIESATKADSAICHYYGNPIVSDSNNTNLSEAEIRVIIYRYMGMSDEEKRVVGQIVSFIDKLHKVKE